MTYPSLKCYRKPEMHLNTLDKWFLKDTVFKCKNHFKIQFCQYRCIGMCSTGITTCFDRLKMRFGKINGNQFSKKKKELMVNTIFGIVGKMEKF